MTEDSRWDSAEDLQRTSRLSTTAAPRNFLTIGDFADVAAGCDNLGAGTLFHLNEGSTQM
jgi:hypothetical protein